MRARVRNRARAKVRARVVAGPVTSPCWPCTYLSPVVAVGLAPVYNTFSPTV